MRILVVDDETDLADAVARGLRREGYAVDVAGDGESALEKVAYSEYDLIYLDLTMPSIDGREVCRRVRADDSIERDIFRKLSGMREMPAAARAWSRTSAVWFRNTAWSKAP